MLVVFIQPMFFVDESRLVAFVACFESFAHPRAMVSIPRVNSGALPCRRLYAEGNDLQASAMYGQTIHR